MPRAMRQSFSWGELACYLPAVAVALFAITCVGYYHALKMGGDRSVDNSHLQYAVAVGIFCIAQWWNWALSILGVAISTNQYSRREKWQIWALFIELAIFACVLCYNLPDVGGAAQKSMFARIQAVSGVEIGHIADFNNTTTAVAIVGILFSLCTLAANYNMRDAIRGADSVQLFNLSLYSAAAFLAAGIFEIFSIFSWGWNAQNCTRAPVCDLNPGDVATCAGILFSTLLVIMYLPTAIVMDWRMKTLYRAAPNDQKEKGFSDWATSAGLPTSPIKAVSSYGAVLLPFTTGLLAKILQLHDLAH